MVPAVGPNWWQYPAESYDCYPPYPPVNVSFQDNTVIGSRAGVPPAVLARAGAR